MYVAAIPYIANSQRIKRSGIIRQGQVRSETIPVVEGDRELPRPLQFGIYRRIKEAPWINFNKT